MSNDATTTDHPPAKRPLRWRSGLAILLTGTVIYAVLLALRGTDLTERMMFGYYVGLPTLFALAIWWVFFSGTPMLTRSVIASLPVLAVGGFLSRYEVVGMDGAMMPIVVPRGERQPNADSETYYEQTLRDLQPDTSESEPMADEESTLIAEPGDWPGFQGPDRDGIVRNVRIRTDWKTNPPREVWRHPVGEGWSSFAVVGEFAVTMEQHGEFECVVCYESQTGEPRWIHREKVRYETAMGGIGPRATPVIFDGVVYALGATGLLHALDLRSGTLRWQRNILKDASAPLLEWGMSGTPLVTNSHVFVNAGGKNDRAVIAYDRETGEPAWSSVSAPASYAAPRIERIGGVDHLLIFDGAGLRGLNPDTGAERWFTPWTNTFEINVGHPIVLEERYVFFGSGYNAGSKLIDLGSRDSNLKDSDAGWNPEEVWEKKNFFKLKFSDAIHHRGAIYGFDDSIFACIDAMTGKRNWKRGRYGFGQFLLFEDQELLLIVSERGELALVDADPKRFTERHRVDAISGKTWNTLAFANGLLYVRNAQEAACFDLRPVDEATK